MKQQCKVCGSMVEDVSGICPVCGALLTNDQETVQGGAGEETTGELRRDMRLAPQQDMQQLQSGNTYGGASGTYTQGMPQGNVYTDSIPYNYQNPYQTPPAYVKKKKLFSILSLVLSILALLTACCVSWLSLVCSLAALVLGILALVKKQVKPPAIIGLVVGGIALLTSGIMISMNLMMQSMIGTDMPGIFRQCYDVQLNGSIPLEGIAFVAPDTYVEYFLYDDHLFSDKSGQEIGVYSNYNYMDSEVQDIIGEKVIYAMTQGYEIKDITCLVLSGTYSTDYYVFAVPQDYEPGDTIYYIDGTSDADYRLLPVNTTDLSTYSEPLPY